jgi:hypothetical protein
LARKASMRRGDRVGLLPIERCETRSGLSRDETRRIAANIAKPSNLL